MVAKRLKKSSSGPKITEGRRITAVGNGGEHRGLALRLAAGIGGGGIRVRADGRDMHDIVDARGLGGLGDGAGALRLNLREFLSAALGQNADEIDDGVGPAQRGGDRIRGGADWPAPP